VVYAEEKVCAVLLPTRVALALREMNELKHVTVEIAKIESLDTASLRIPFGQRLRSAGDVLHVVVAKPAIRLVHITHDDSQVLKPEVVAVRVCWDWPPLRSEILRELDLLTAESQASGAYSHAEEALQVLDFGSSQFGLAFLLKMQNFAVEIDGTVQIAYRDSDGFNAADSRDLRQCGEGAEADPEDPGNNA
jgi:hypothetical protein